MNYELPTTVTVNEKEYKIRSDYRAVLDMITALNDPELDDREKAIVCLEIFYVDIPEDLQTALKECFKFINFGKEEEPKSVPKVVDWEQDFDMIIAPINRVAGREIRMDKYLHWWTFLGYYNEIGDCLFAQVVGIRDKKARHKKLNDAEKEFARRNADIITIKHRYSDAENAVLEAWANG